MRKIEITFCAFLIILGSCNTDCNDCSPTGYTQYYMKNSRSEDIRLYWFGNTTLPSNIAHGFTISAGERILLYESSLTGTSGLISTPPFNSITPYDSIKIESASATASIYLNEDCSRSDNPLCEESYELLKFVDTKKQQIKEWEFEVK